MCPHNRMVPFSISSSPISLYLSSLIIIRHFPSWMLPQGPCTSILLTLQGLWHWGWWLFSLLRYLRLHLYPISTSILHYFIMFSTCGIWTFIHVYGDESVQWHSEFNSLHHSASSFRLSFMDGHPSVHALCKKPCDYTHSADPSAEWNQKATVSEHDYMHLVDPPEKQPVFATSWLSHIQKDLNI